MYFAIKGLPKLKNIIKRLELSLLPFPHKLKLILQDAEVNYAVGSMCNDNEITNAGDYGCEQTNPVPKHHVCGCKKYGIDVSSEPDNCLTPVDLRTEHQQPKSGLHYKFRSNCKFFVLNSIC